MLGALKGQLAPAIALADDKELRQSLRITDERTGTSPSRIQGFGLRVYV